MDRAVARRRSADEPPATAAAEATGEALANLGSRLVERIPAHPGQLRGLRRRVEAWADAHNIGTADLMDLQLALGEAVSNGMEHAYPPGTADAEVEIELELGFRVVLARVRDRGQWRQARSRPGTRGRGLAMIESLSDEMRVTSAAHGTEVCFTLPLRD